MNRRKTVALVTLLLLSLFVAACGEGEEAPIEEGATVVEEEALMTDPEAFVGEPVVIEGRVENIISLAAFTVGEPPVLVLATNPRGFEADIVVEDTVLLVPGTVGIFDLEDYEEAYGIDLDDSLYTLFVGEPYIAAEPADIGYAESFEEE